MLPRSMAKNAMAYRNVAMFATVNDRARNNVRSSTGSGCRAERNRKRVPMINAPAKQAMMGALDQPQVGPSVMPSTNDASVTAMSTAPR